MKFTAAVLLAIANTASASVQAIIEVDVDDALTGGQSQCAALGYPYAIKMNNCPHASLATGQVRELFNVFSGQDNGADDADNDCTLSGGGETLGDNSVVSDSCKCPDFLNSILQDTISVECLSDTGSCGKQAWVNINGLDNVDISKVKTGGTSLIFDEIGFMGTCASVDANTAPVNGLAAKDKSPKAAYDYFNTAASPVCNTCKAISNVELCFDCNGDSGGDPHFKTFGGEWFDFHGGCDLVLADMPGFAHGLGLTVHVRTKVRFDWSYIEQVAVKIGDDVFEVSSYGQYWLNGVEGAVRPDHEIPNFGDYSVEHSMLNKQVHRFNIDLGNNQKIAIRSNKDFLWITPDIISNADGRGSTGLLGSWERGVRYARDGSTIVKDPTEFGLEWQVRPEDPQLFTELVGAQWPQKCEMPTYSNEMSLGRRLGMGISAELAGRACRNVKNSEMRELCMTDVLAAQDLSIGTSGFYNDLEMGDLAGAV